MSFGNPSLDYNGVVLTLCAVFIFSHVVIRTTRLTVDESIAVERIQRSSTNESSEQSPPSELGNDPREKLVSLCPTNFDGRRLGNQLFNFAAIMYVAESTGRQVVLPRHYVRDSVWIDRWFEVPDVKLVDGVVPQLCPCRNVTERRPLAFERSIGQSVRKAEHTKTLLTCGWFQSWRYAAGTDAGRRLRNQLRWKPEVLGTARRYLADRRPLGWNSTARYRRVGIHVRIGDLLDTRKLAFGYTIPGPGYFRRAIGFFVRLYRNNFVQFVVTSDDVDWTRTHLRLGKIVAGFGTSIDLVYSDSRDRGPGSDLALLSSCDDVIMSTGTYGWWAGWLAGGKTVYYRRWPRRGSPLDAAFERRDFFPPHWIAL